MTAVAPPRHAPPQAPASADDIAAALAWWRDAGVSHDYADDATTWLAEPDAESADQPDKPTAKVRTSKPASAPQAPLTPIAGDPAAWPKDLAAFRDWWIASPDLAPGGFGARVPPRGEAGAANLFLVPEPDADDAATLLSGPQGNLLRSFLSAAGLAGADCYFASALPATITMPDWQELRARGLDALLAHHIGLARPQRIIAFGRNLLPLLGHDTAQAATNGLQFSTNDSEIPLLAGPTLNELLRAPRRRSRFWQRWLTWTDD